LITQRAERDEKLTTQGFSKEPTARWRSIISALGEADNEKYNAFPLKREKEARKG